MADTGVAVELDRESRVVGFWIPADTIGVDNANLVRLCDGAEREGRRLHPSAREQFGRGRFRVSYTSRGDVAGMLVTFEAEPPATAGAGERGSPPKPARGLANAETWDTLLGSPWSSRFERSWEDDLPRSAYAELLEKIAREAEAEAPARRERWRARLLALPIVRPPVGLVGQVRGEGSVESVIALLDSIRPQRRLGARFSGFLGPLSREEQCGLTVARTGFSGRDWSVLRSVDGDLLILRTADDGFRWTIDLRFGDVFADR
jgi:hypothetical protein